MLGGIFQDLRERILGRLNGSHPPVGNTGLLGFFIGNIYARKCFTWQHSCQRFMEGHPVQFHLSNSLQSTICQQITGYFYWVTITAFYCYLLPNNLELFENRWQVNFDLFPFNTNILARNCTENPRVGSSILSLGTLKNKGALRQVALSPFCLG